MCGKMKNYVNPRFLGSFFCLLNSRPPQFDLLHHLLAELNLYAVLALLAVLNVFLTHLAEILFPPSTLPLGFPTLI
jgi:hypothetical protein